MSQLRRLIHEVHRRSLWQVLLIYIGGALMAYQVIQALTEGLHLPAWFPPFAIVLFIIGLPIVLATAFVQEGVGRSEAQRAPSAEAEDTVAETRERAKREPRGVRRLLTWRNAMTGGALAFGLWGVVATGWLLSHGGASALSPEERKSIAVLPFANIGGDPENEYFSDGITGDIIAHLTKIADLKVISRTSVMQYTNTGKNLRVIGEELGVAAILEGEVQRAGDRVRINAQLIDAETDKHLWAEQYNRQLTDIFAIQSDVARQIAAALEATLSPEEKERIEREPTKDLEAYNLYLRGRYFWNQRTEEGLRRALEYFEQALDLDSSYALAYSGLADSYSLLGYWYYTRPRDIFPKAKEAAGTALAIDSTLAEAHNSLAWTQFIYDWDFAGAEEEFQRAIDLNPGYAQGRYWYGYYLASQGRFEEAFAQLRRAEELDPLAPIAPTAGAYARLMAGDYDGVLDQARKALDLVPDFWQAHALSSLGLVRKGRWDEAIAEGGQAVRLSGGAPWALLALGIVHAESGRRREAQEVLERMEQRLSEGYLPLTHIAFVYAALGEVDLAFEWLDRAYEERDIFITDLKVRPVLEGLRSDPRFTELLRRVGFE